MKKINAAYGVVQCMAPYEGAKHRHSPVMDSYAEATSAFHETVKDAKADLSVMRVALLRYTAGRTQLLDEWHRGSFTCNLHRESDPTKQIQTERAA